MWEGKNTGWVLSWAKEEQIVKAGNVEHVKKHLMHSVARGYLLIMVTGMGYEEGNSQLSVMFFFFK